VGSTPTVVALALFCLVFFTFAAYLSLACLAFHPNMVTCKKVYRSSEIDLQLYFFSTTLAHAAGSLWNHSILGMNICGVNLPILAASGMCERRGQPWCKDRS
jgi:hypothetical protein